MSIISNIRGITGNLLSIGFNGPNLKNRNNILEIRNATDDGYASLRVGTPVDGYSVANKQYVDSSISSGSGSSLDILLYGDGYSGNLTLSGSTEYYLGDGYYFDTISFAAGFTGHLNCMGNDLVCRTLDLRNAAAGVIRESVPTEATNATNATSGTASVQGTGGTIIANTGYLMGGVNGVAGAAPPNNAVGNAGSAGTSFSTSIVNGGNGADAGLGGKVTADSEVGTLIRLGGAGGTGGASRLKKVINRNVTLGQYINYVDGYWIKERGGMSAGSGGSGAVTNTGTISKGGAGGGSGYSRGVMRIKAGTIITDGTTAVGAISVRGGNGGHGGGGWAIYSGGAQGAGGGSGGGGGGAGFIDLTFASRIGTVMQLIDLSGGTGGNGGTGSLSDAGHFGHSGTGGYAGGRGSAFVRCTGSGASQAITIWDGGITHVASSGQTGASNAYYAIL